VATLAQTKTETTLKVQPLVPDRYGVVIIWNADGSVNRRFPITNAEVLALRAPGAGAPPGVTREEWESGRACVAGQSLDPGGAEVKATGELLVKLSDDVDLLGSHALLYPEEWEKDARDVVSVAPEIAPLLVGKK